MGTFISPLLPSRPAVQNIQALTTHWIKQHLSGFSLSPCLTVKSQSCAWTPKFVLACAVHILTQQQLSWLRTEGVSGSNLFLFAVTLSAVPPRPHPTLHRPTGECALNLFCHLGRVLNTTAEIKKYQVKQSKVTFGLTPVEQPASLPTDQGATPVKKEEYELLCPPQYLCYW